MKNVFDRVSPQLYHTSLYENWIHLERDGIVPKANISIFGFYAGRFYEFCLGQNSIPTYDIVIGWFTGENNA